MSRMITPPSQTRIGPGGVKKSKSVSLDKSNCCTDYAQPTAAAGIKRSTTKDWFSKTTRQHQLDRLLGEFLLLHTEAMASVKAEVQDSIKQVEALTRLSQALDRTVNALVKATPPPPYLAIARDVLQKQVAFVESRFPQHAPALLVILEPFGEELIKTYDE
ncbi:MAG: DUF1804 family protein [Magnetococcales bacterium]|nr:DUF1804 family protein [Magnetococcales bacterium]